MALSFLSEDISTVSEVTAAIESMAQHNMTQLLNSLERRHIQVGFWELPSKTQNIIREMIEKNHWSTRVLQAIVLDIPTYS